MLRFFFTHSMRDVVAAIRRITAQPHDAPQLFKKVRNAT